jgi:hypothetical protein
MSLETLPLAIAGWLVSRRHRRAVNRGTARSDDAILRWPAQLRATPTNLTPRRSAKSTRGGR